MPPVYFEQGGLIESANVKHIEHKVLIRTSHLIQQDKRKKKDTGNPQQELWGLYYPDCSLPASAYATAERSYSISEKERTAMHNRGDREKDVYGKWKKDRRGGRKRRRVPRARERERGTAGVERRRGSRGTREREIERERGRRRLWNESTPWLYDWGQRTKLLVFDGDYTATARVWRRPHHRCPTLTLKAFVRHLSSLLVIIDCIYIRLYTFL